MLAFQQLDRYHEGYVGARLGGLFPYDWGVVAIELDERALVAGQVRVQRFEGVLPDGIPLAFDGAHPEVPAIRPVEGHFKPTQQFLEVFPQYEHTAYPRHRIIHATYLHCADEI